jgi:hyperosmotically inducible periplasmic protein
MKNQLFATSLLIGAVAVLSPVAVYSADQSTGSSAKTAVKDSVITTKIKASMAKDKQVSATHVKVDTDDKGIVHLSGTAKSKAEADRAEQIARNTEGVTTVHNDIQIGTK